MGCGASSGSSRVADASVAGATAPPPEPAAKGAPSEPPPEPRKDVAESPAEPASAALLQEPTSAVKLNFRDTSRYYDPESHGAPGLVDDGVRGRLIDGKAIAAECRALIRSEVEAARAHASLEWRPPRLVVVLVGADAASKVYVKQKQKACQEVGIESELLELPVETTPSELIDTVGRLNADNTCDGILVQLPLPTPELQNEQQAVLQAILPDKDVDGFHPYNLGRLTSREPKLRPCTPFGVMHLLWSTGVNPYGLRCVVVGASNHVGRPMMLELLLNGASVQILHRFSRDLEEHVRNADCVVVACGKAGLVKGEWIRPGAIVMDVGINRLESGKLVGDVDFDVAKERAGWITPVPGGVGPMTVAMLLRNTMIAYHAHRAAKSAAGSAPAALEPAGLP